MKKILCTLLSLLLLFSFASCNAGQPKDTAANSADITTMAAAEEKIDVNVAVLKGPTGMGAAYLMEKNENGQASENYKFSIETAADAVTAGIVSGSFDIAAVPTNLAAVLNSKDGVDVQVLAVNTLGVLYLCEKGSTVNSLSDLAGKSILTAGEGTAADAVLTRIISTLPEASKPTVTYASEHSEVVTQAIAGNYDIVVLPEPFVTTLLSKTDAFRVALNLTTEWESAGYGTLVMGCLIATKKFITEHPEAVEAFIADYAASVEYVNANTTAAAQLIEKFGISTAAVAEKALPNCNIVCMTGKEMKTALSAFYAQLMQFKPALIGGALPGDELYYGV